MQNTQHPDDAAVDALATAMKAKLAKQRAKGYGGWNTDCTQQRLSDMLRTHVEKGDPVDVANFCAFLLARGEAIAAAQQAVQADAPLPLLLRDIARDLGITVPQACIALKPLGNYSTNSAVTAEMARMLRDHFPAPAHHAEGVPAQNVQPFGWIITKSKLPGDVEFTQDPVRENLARSFGYQTQALYTHSTQQGMDAQRWQIVRQHISAEYSAGHACFVVRIEPVHGENIMRGSVAQHFTKAVDDRAKQIKIAHQAWLAAQAKQGAQA